MIVNFTLSAPLSHGQTGSKRLGNHNMFRRLPIWADNAIITIPVVSGNSIRGIMRREIMRELYTAANITYDQFESISDKPQKVKRAWDRTYAALFGGGTIDSLDVSITPVDLRSLRASLPPLSLFGSALYGAMLSGAMRVGFAVPKCKETITAGLWRGNEEGAVYSGELITDVGLTRYIEREQADPKRSGVKPMPYTIETLVPGTEMQFIIDFDTTATALEKDCAIHAVNLITYLGGARSKGFGSVTMQCEEKETGDYMEWLQKNEIRAAIFNLAEILL